MYMGEVGLTLINIKNTSSVRPILQLPTGKNKQRTVKMTLLSLAIDIVRDA